MTSPQQIAILTRSMKQPILKLPRIAGSLFAIAKPQPAAVEPQSLRLRVLLLYRSYPSRHRSFAQSCMCIVPSTSLDLSLRCI